jgi:hypothetical protein
VTTVATCDSPSVHETIVLFVGRRSLEAEDDEPSCAADAGQACRNSCIWTMFVSKDRSGFIVQFFAFLLKFPALEFPVELTRLSRLVEIVFCFRCGSLAQPDDRLLCNCRFAAQLRTCAPKSRASLARSRSDATRSSHSNSGEGIGKLLVQLVYDGAMHGYSPASSSGTM